MPIQGFVVLTLEFRKEDGYWLGRCRELGTATDGRSLERVVYELGELVELHLNELEEVGERERVFRERGIKCYADDRPPTEVDAHVSVSESHRMLIQMKPVAIHIANREPVPA